MNCQMFWLEDVLIRKMCFKLLKHLLFSRCFNTCKVGLLVVSEIVLTTSPLFWSLPRWSKVIVCVLYVWCVLFVILFQDDLRWQNVFPINSLVVCTFSSSWGCFFNKFIGKTLYLSVKKGIIHSHRDLNSVSSSTDKTNLLGSIPSRLRSPTPRVRKPPRATTFKCLRKHFLEVETSGSQFTWIYNHSHRWPWFVNITRVKKYGVFPIASRRDVFLVTTRSNGKGQEEGQKEEVIWGRKNIGEDSQNITPLLHIRCPLLERESRHILLHSVGSPFDDERRWAQCPL
jgi:hypothetical protein